MVITNAFDKGKTAHASKPTGTKDEDKEGDEVDAKNQKLVFNHRSQAGIPNGLTKVVNGGKGDCGPESDPLSLRTHQPDLGIAPEAGIPVERPAVRERDLCSAGDLRGLLCKVQMLDWRPVPAFETRRLPLDAERV